MICLRLGTFLEAHDARSCGSLFSTSSREGTKRLCQTFCLWLLKFIILTCFLIFVPDGHRHRKTHFTNNPSGIQDSTTPRGHTNRDTTCCFHARPLRRINAYHARTRKRIDDPHTRTSHFVSHRWQNALVVHHGNPTCLYEHPPILQHKQTSEPRQKQLTDGCKTRRYGSWLVTDCTE